MIRRIVTTLIVVAGLGAIVASGLLVTTGEEDEGPGCPGVELLFPPAGSNVLRQSEIGADLETGRTGVLRIDGVEIPEDQLRRNEPLNQVFFTPGEGQEIEQLAAGARTVVVEHWSPVEGETRADSSSCPWSFQVS